MVDVGRRLFHKFMCFYLQRFGIPPKMEMILYLVLSCPDYLDVSTSDKTCFGE